MKSLSLENRLPVEVLKEMFEYKNGVLVWKERPDDHFTTSKGRKVFNTMHSGQIAGTPLCPDKMYLISQITYKGAKHAILLHIATWAIITGEYPQGDIDHGDGNGMNNEFSNLSDSGTALNMRNKAKYKNNRSGLCGVHWSKVKDKWVAVGTINGGKVHLGYFYNFFDAACARKVWEIDYNFTERHGN